ncbi:MAG: hypothetical protein QM755_19120 [Luteolibacter sp.]
MDDALEEPVKRSRWVVVLLWLVPAWLLVSAGAGIWMYFQAKKEQERKESIKFARAVSAKSIADDLQKVATFIGPRNPTVNDGIGLTRAAAWIEGTLGPSNTGYTVKQIPGPSRWPILQVDFRGTEEKAPALWVVCAYDSAPEEKAGDTTCSAPLVAQIAAAQALAKEQPAATIHFVFMPHSGDARTNRVPFAPLAPDDNKAAVLANTCMEKLVGMIREDGPALSVLVLDDLSSGQFVNVSTPDTTNPVLAIVPSALGVRPSIPANGMFVSFLHQQGLPAVRISSSAAEEPDEDQLTPLCGQLVELIRRLATKK